jgi:hypothetical protein
MVRRKGTAMFSRIRDRIAKLEERVAPQNRIFDKPVFLLCGFAVENAIKVFLVYENPNWVSNGRLSSRLKSHNLSGLQNQSNLIPRRKSGIRVLQEFESGSGFVVPVSLVERIHQTDGRVWKKAHFAAG